MKTTFALIILALITPLCSLSQTYSFDVETEPSDIIIYRDTISNPNCIWQIGQPNKNTFTSAYSGNNVIVTDTVNSYPINDTSSFIIKHRVGGGFLYSLGNISLQGWYKVNSDTLNDFGKIEFSPDNGMSWVSLSNDTLIYGHEWPYSNSPTLSGNSNGWRYFEYTLDGIDIWYNFQQLDTVQYRFTYISDNNFDNQDGLMFDNIKIVDVFSAGLDDTENKKNNSFPNPFKSSITILPVIETNEILFYNLEGRLIYSQKLQLEKLLEINTSKFVPGIYFVVQKDKKGAIISSEKLVKY